MSAMRLSRLLMLTGLLLASASGRAVDPDAQRLAACAACHGPLGQAAGNADSYVPHLAGKPAGYLFEQLRAFRDGRRAYAPMAWLTRNLDDDYLEEMAGFYARQAPPPARNLSTDDLDPSSRRRAEQLVYEGDAQRPACAACHGVDLAGLQPGVPALTGLPADYVIAQLGAWRTGVRRARAPDCMADIARSLPAEDLRLLGEWLSVQPHSDQARPAAAGSFTLPVDCGALRAGSNR